MRLHQIAQRAHDLDRAAEFYVTHFDAQVMAKFEPPGLLFLRLDGARLLLDRNAPSALIYLQVADVRTEAERLRGAGVAIESGPLLQHTDEAGTFGPVGWEEWMAFVRDSEGNLLGLASRHAPT